MLTDKQFREHKKKIDEMSHYEMGRLYRKASSGHPYFISSTMLCKYFYAKWDRLGGWNAKLSKAIGCGR